MPDLLPYLTAMAVAVVAVYTDSSRGLIPNRITIPAALAGLALNAIGGGWDGFVFALQGLAVGFGLVLLPCLLGRTGGGDLKLTAAFGALLGPASVLSIFLSAAVVGGAVALVLIAKRWLALFAIGYLPVGRLRDRLVASALSLGPFPFAACLLVGLTVAARVKGG